MPCEVRSGRRGANEKKSPLRGFERYAEKPPSMLRLAPVI
ncbi:hypothetical protein SMTE4_38180 [Serratia marcescens]|nr:hypothetical protein SMTE4_38180 [Serratia marcescens]CAI1739714.1 Uncharacterised protein [Serratia marcescens]